MKQPLSHYGRGVLLFLVFLLSPSLASAGEEAFTLEGSDYSRTMSFGGMERSYYVHVPASYSPGKPAPVILNLHGGGGNANAQKTISMMDQSSEKYGFIAVYPEGTGARFRLINPRGYTWNAGKCCGWAKEHEIDDVGFINAMLDALALQFNIDEKRVFATGISNGAIMSYRLACELSNRIAAIAPVSGPMEMEKCVPARPISVIHFHGTDDKFAPYGGGKGPRSLTGQFFESVEKTINFWLKQNNIVGGPRIIRQGKATGAYYGPGSGGTEVALWSIKDGGHTWPGGQFGVLGEGFLGPMTRDISANDLMWEFFQRHPMP